MDREHKRMAKKGYKFFAEIGTSGVYCTQQPSVEALVARYGEKARSAKVVQISA